jgi:hypothetical protein
MLAPTVDGAAHADLGSAAAGTADLGGSGAVDRPLPDAPAPADRSAAGPPLVDAPAAAADATADPDGPARASDAAPPPATPDARTDACAGPVSCSAASPAGLCDPVCQLRCGCHQKCTFVGTQLACQDLAPAPVDVYGSCSPTADRCRAGAVCLEEIAPACGAHCYRFCRTDFDCGGPERARCVGEVQIGGTSGTYRVCSPPLEACDPTGEAACADPQRSLPLFGCYILSSHVPDQAVCDCAGIKAEGAPCDFERECRPGLECVKLVTDARCRRLCRLDGAGTPCAPGQTCTPFSTPDGPSRRFGYCR